MDETMQETFPAETETQLVETVPALETQPVETVPAETVTQATEPVTVETVPLPTEEVPATIAATVPPTVSNYDPYQIIYGVDSFSETTVATSETIPVTTEPVYIEVIETVGSDIVHSSLFGAFLICGTLVGLALLRKIYGS